MLFLIGSSQSQSDKRYTQTAPEIDLVKQVLQAYNAGDWAKMQSAYSEDAGIYHNSAEPTDVKSYLNNLQQTISAMESYALTYEENYLERVITDEGETWVNFWGDWQGTAKGTNRTVSVPVHFTVRVKEGEVMEEHAYYNQAPLMEVITEAAAMQNPGVQYVEMWNAKDAWKALPEEERAAFMSNVGPAIEQMMNAGMKVICFGVNEGDTHERIGYDFFSVLHFPNSEVMRTFEQAVVDSGWYDYFEQVNISGKAETPAAVMGAMIKM